MLHILKAGLAVAAVAVAGLPGPAAAQDYPSRSVKIIVPFGAGGPADVYARVVGQHLQEALKQSFVIENRPGAGAVIGTGEVAKSAPDGYTLLMMSNTHTVNETLLPNRPYQLMRDFVPVAPVNYSDLLMVVHPSVPAKDLKEFLALLKAKPGDAQLRLVGSRHALSHGRRAVQSHERHQHRARPASRQRRRAHQRHRRPRADDDRCHHHHGADAKAGQVRALGHDGRQAFDGAARRADLVRSGRARLRGDDLARHHGARGHAESRSSTSSTPRSTRC